MYTFSWFYPTSLQFFLLYFSSLHHHPQSSMSHHPRKPSRAHPISLTNRVYLLELVCVHLKYKNEIDLKSFNVCLFKLSRPFLASCVRQYLIFISTFQAFSLPFSKVYARLDCFQQLNLVFLYFLAFNSQIESVYPQVF